MNSTYGTMLKIVKEQFDFNIEVISAAYKTAQHLFLHKKALCSVSGGSDSDIMLDMIHALDIEKKVTYVWFDTGIEYEATKRHLVYLEEKYGISIRREKAIKTVPISVKEYGVPFLSKRVSEYIERLQRHSFCWEDRPLEELYSEYPKCKAALRWWCNDYRTKDGRMGNSNIISHFQLKEFIIENAPSGNISKKCCQYAKKCLGNRLIKRGKYDLDIQGVRRAEGGTRAISYESCYSNNLGSLDSKKDYDEFRPLFYFTDNDKAEYKKHRNIRYSDCYEVYGMKRTGCFGCPFGSRFEQELEIIKKYEPKLYKAALNIFGQSYEYTRKYREFKERKKSNRRAGAVRNQVDIEDWGKELTCLDITQADEVML